MNASYALQVFSSKTINEVIMFLAAHLKANVHPSSNNLVKGETMWEKYKVCIDELEKKLNIRTPENVISTFCLLQYQIAIHCIFVERFLNRNWQLN